MTRLLLAVIFFVFVTPLIAQAQVDLPLYMADGGNGQSSTLYVINPANGQVVKTIGDMGEDVIALAVQPGTQELFGITSNASVNPNALITIDVSTAATTLVGALPVSDIEDISFHDQDRLQVLTAAGEVDSIDPVTAGFSAMPVFVELSNIPDGDWGYEVITGSFRNNMVFGCDSQNAATMLILFTGSDVPLDPPQGQVTIITTPGFCFTAGTQSLGGPMLAVRIPAAGGSQRELVSFDINAPGAVVFRPLGVLPDDISALAFGGAQPRVVPSLSPSGLTVLILILPFVTFLKLKIPLILDR